MRILLFVLTLLLSGMTFANEGGGGGGENGNFYKMEPLVVNLQNGGFLNFVPQLKLVDPKDGDLLKAYTPILRHLLIKSLIGQSAAQLQSVEFMNGFSHKAAELINQALDGDYINEVLFDRWLIQ